jgi:hypothetical protein
MESSPVIPVGLWVLALCSKFSADHSLRSALVERLGRQSRPRPWALLVKPAHCLSGGHTAGIPQDRVDLRSCFSRAFL